MESQSNRASEARQARRAAPCGQGLRRCGDVVKVKPCPHVHAVGAVVHQAAQARPLKARFVGGMGGVSTWLKPSSRTGVRASGAPHARPAGGLVSVSTTCRTPKSLSTMRASGYLAGAMPALPPRPVTRGERTSSPLNRLTLGAFLHQNAGNPFINDCTHPHPHHRAQPAFC